MKRHYPGITKITGGRIRVRVRATDPRTGREKEKEKIINRTVQDALKVQAEMREEIRKADHVTKQVPRLRDYVASWLRSRTLVVKTSTAMMYADTLAHYVLPDFGDWFLDRIRDADVREWQISQRKRLAAGTVNGALRLLRMVLADAVAEFQLPHNPAGRVRLLPLAKATDQEPNLFTSEELGRVLVAFKQYKPRHYPLAATLALTGQRFGEGSALRWSDIDEEAGVIHIRRRQYRGTIDVPKTEGSVRDVPLVPELAAILREHREKMQANGFAVDQDALVFCSRRGGLLPACWLRWPMASLLKKLGIKKRVTTHGLRRTLNNLSRQVAGEIVTRSITGHVTQAMTEHYSHVDRREKLAAANSIVQLPGLRKALTGSNGEFGGGNAATEGPDTRSNEPNLLN